MPGGTEDAQALANNYKALRRAVQDEHDQGKQRAALGQLVSTGLKLVVSEQTAKSIILELTDTSLEVTMWHIWCAHASVVAPLCATMCSVCKAVRIGARKRVRKTAQFAAVVLCTWRASDEQQADLHSVTWQQLVARQASRSRPYAGPLGRRSFRRTLTATHQNSKAGTRTLVRDVKGPSAARRTQDDSGTGMRQAHNKRRS